MNINAELILASKNAITQDILYTWKLTFPRIILAEVNTHTIASKNTASSRAIPVPRMMERVIKDPFVPYIFGTYSKGMQAGPPLEGLKLDIARKVWKLGRWLDLAEAAFDHYVLHLSKEITNRIYERYVWTEQIFSTTDMNNLLNLRNHWMAEPHFHSLASQMSLIKEIVGGTLKSSYGSFSSIGDKVQILQPGEWHLPFVGLWNSVKSRPVEDLKKISAGRCAWVSYYMPGDGSKKMDNEEAAINTFKKLAESDPKHLSPLQHQATPIPADVRCGNYAGFLQFRKEIENEAGGDKVIPSITSSRAQLFIKEYLIDHPEQQAAK